MLLPIRNFPGSQRLWPPGPIRAAGESFVKRRQILVVILNLKRSAAEALTCDSEVSRVIVQLDRSVTNWNARHIRRNFTPRPDFQTGGARRNFKVGVRKSLDDSGGPRFYGATV